MRRPDEIRAALEHWLEEHHAVISLEEAEARGATYSMVRGRVARGEWDRPYPGVYRSTSAPKTHYQELRAACLATGGKASHSSGAWVWKMLKEFPLPIEVSVTRDTHPTRRKLGIVVHRSRDLEPSAVTTRDGIEVTKPLRTLVDLAATATPAQLTEAVETALGTRLVSIAALGAEIRRLSKKGRPGVGRLRQHLIDRGFVDAPPPSVLEARLQRLVNGLGIAPATAEVRAGKNGQYRVDVAWKEIRFAAEVDGYTWHFSPKQKRYDELRRRRLREAGWTIVVFDWWQMTKKSKWVGNEIRTTFFRLTAASLRGGDGAKASHGP